MGPGYQDFIDRQIAKGRFGSASEAIRAGLRMLEEHENRLERLQAAVDEGDRSDDVPDFSFENFLARMNGSG